MTESQPAVVMKLEDLPREPNWLGEQPYPIIAFGKEPTSAKATNADVIVSDEVEAHALFQRIEQQPIGALTLVQVLRSTEKLPINQALDIESLAYATLQTGENFKDWLNAQNAEPKVVTGQGDAILVSRKGSVIDAVLNRPQHRNSMTVEMRDAIIEVLELLQWDDTITELRISGNGPCYSVGGELREFGSFPDAATAHWVRTVQSPARSLARLADRVSFHVHKACIGSGVELPAFGHKVTAARNTFFQLPELQMGIIPGAGGCVSIPRRIGRQNTAWMVLTGKKINAQKALEWGLIDEILDL